MSEQGADTMDTGAQRAGGDAQSSVQRTRWQRWRRPLIESLAVLAVLLGVRAAQKRSLAEGLAPEVRAADLDGRAVTLGRGEGGPQLVWFFATWCTVCRASEHNVRALAGERSVVLVASESGDDERVRRYVRANGLGGLRVVNDPDGAIARRFGVRAFPTSFAVSEGGRVRASEVGYTTELGLRARRWWAGR